MKSKIELNVNRIFQVSGKHLMQLQFLHDALDTKPNQIKNLFKTIQTASKTNVRNVIFKLKTTIVLKKRPYVFFFVFFNRSLFYYYRLQRQPAV